MEAKKVQDEIIQEVRAIRERLAAEYEYDVQALFEAAKKRQAKSNRRVVYLDPRRVQKQAEESD